MFNRIKFALQGRSPKWNSVRSNFLKINKRCCACSADSKLEVHHIEPFHICPELELNEKNLITLCRNCHLVIGHLRDYNLHNRKIRDDCISFMLKRIEAMALARPKEYYSNR